MRLLSLITLALASSVFSVRVPGADTPLFYLVSSSSTASANLLPLRTSGGSIGGSTLAGSGPIGQFYFFQGQFVAVDPNGPPQTPNPTLRPLISAVQTSTGCSTAGGLVFVQSSSSNKCARPAAPQIRSNSENSQLGASLVLDPGSFYACGPTLDVWYKEAAGDAPAGCNPISLYTVPVV